jgi:NAD(P)H-dependent nitrite reductase small subunit
MSWIEACDLSQLQPGRGLSVKIGWERIAIFWVEEKPYALRDLCPHQGALLSAGGAYAQKNGEPPIVVCPVHYWTFNLTDGVCPYHASMKAVVFPAELRDGKVWVELPGEAAPAELLQK